MSHAFVYNVLRAPAGVVSLTRVRPDEQGGRTVTQDMTTIAANEVDAGSAGLPLGVQVVGRHWRGDVVLAVMAALETQFASSPDYPAGALVPSA